MSELAKTNNQLSKPGTPAQIPTITKAVALMLGGGLKTYGQHPSIDAWAIVLQSRGVLESEIESAVKHFLTRQPEDGGTPSFPSAGEFAGWIIRDREYRQMRERMKAFEEYERAQSQEQLRLSNMEKYGTENPSREQIDERMARLGLSDRLGELTGGEG